MRQRLPDPDRLTGAPRSLELPRGLYVHIPFCRRKCPYCDFHSVAGEEHPIDAYVGAVVTDLRRARAEVGAVDLDTIYLGGGTPTVLPPDRIARILDACGREFRVGAQAEITCECNPGTVDLSVLRELRAAGVNRLSIGVQSFRAEELRFLGRIHSTDQGRQAVLDAGEAGFGEVSLDLIYCLPGQTPGEWAESLDQALQLAPDHVSAYCLQVEPGTPLAAQAEAGEITPMPDDDQADLYARTVEHLEAGGLTQYEISNFARRGSQCRHNLTYWRNQPHVGAGAGAWGFVDGERRQQVADIGAYIAGWQAGEPLWAYREVCSGASAANETLMMGLRLCEGLSLPEFRARHSIDIAAARKAEIDRLSAQGLVSLGDGRLRLTRAGMAVAGEIATLLAFGEEE